MYHVRRNRRGTLLLACSAGHLGPALMRSTDNGATWTEVADSPKFPAGEPRARAVQHVFWLEPAPTSDGVWYAGSSPQGLFVSRDDGLTWQGVSAFNDHVDHPRWVGNDQDQTPDGGKLHSICIDPRDERRLALGMSSGGICVSDDAGATWAEWNEGIEAEYGQDPHNLVQHPAAPDRYWLQSHYGIYVADRAGAGPGSAWQRVGRNLPSDIGDIGFPMVVNPHNADACWVFPMDGTSVWPRTSPGGKPAVWATTDRGATWSRRAHGFPTEQGWWTVKRQAMCADQAGRGSVGLYLGTTSGEVWASADEGAQFSCIARHLPHIFSVAYMEEP